MPVEILYSDYELIPLSKPNAKASAKPRKGALLCIDGGYADLHPWPEFGDLPLEQQLLLIQQNKLSSLIERAFLFASIDRHHRSTHSSAFTSLSIPRSHTLITNIESLIDIAPLNKGTYKVKIGADPSKEALTLNTLSSLDITLRLDANETFSKKTFLSFWNSLNEDMQRKIEFIEDPFPLAEDWSLEQSIPLALDKAHGQYHPDNYAYRIIKPASQDHLTIASQEVAQGRKIVVTSSMDHPLGQVASAWCASVLHQHYSSALSLCGLLSHTVYETNPFSEILRVNAGQLIPPEGTGFGFDDLLRTQKWHPLK